MMFWSLVLFALSTLVSQSAMDFFSTLLCLSVLWKMYAKYQGGEKPRDLIYSIGFDWIWILWVIWVGVSFLFSPLSDTDWLMRLVEFKWIFVLYAVIWSLHDLPIRPAAQVPAAILLGICSSYAILVWFLGFDPIHPDYDLAPWSGGHRTGGFLSNAMTFGHIYGLYFCFLIGPTLMALKWRSPYLKFLVPALLLTGIAVILSFTRGMWLAMAVATILMTFIFQFRIGLVVTVLGSLLMWLTFQVWPALAERISHTFTNGDERQWIWAAHWKIFLDHPITGVGYGENYRLLPEYYKMVGAPDGVIISHAHNQYLHFLAGTGVPGLIVYLMVLFFFLILNWRVYREFGPRDPFLKGLALGCLGAQIAFFVGGLTEANFEHAKIKYVMILVWSIVVWLGYETQILRRRI